MSPGRRTSGRAELHVEEFMTIVEGRQNQPPKLKIRPDFAVVQAVGASINRHTLAELGGRLPCYQIIGLLEPKPAGDTALSLRCLPLHSLVKLVNRSAGIFPRFFCRFLRLSHGVLCKLGRLGLSLSCFLRDHGVGFVQFLSRILHLKLAYQFTNSLQAFRPQNVKLTDESILEPAFCAHSSPCF